MKSTTRNDVPLSERGKEEELTFDEKVPSAVFALVGMSYLVVMLLVFAGMAVCFFLWSLMS